MMEVSKVVTLSFHCLPICSFFLGLFLLHQNHLRLGFLLSGDYIALFDVGIGILLFMQLLNIKIIRVWF